MSRSDRCLYAFVSLSRSVRTLSTCLSASPRDCLSVCLPVSLSLSQSVSVCVCISLPAACRSVCLAFSVWLCICPSVLCLLVCLYTTLPVYQRISLPLSVYVSVSVSLSFSVSLSLSVSLCLSVSTCACQLYYICLFMCLSDQYYETACPTVHETTSLYVVEALSTAYTFISAYLPACLSSRLIVCLVLSVYLSVCISARICLYSIYNLSIYLSIYLPIAVCLPWSRTISQPACLSVDLSICLVCGLTSYTHLHTQSATQRPLEQGLGLIPTFIRTCPIRQGRAIQARALVSLKSNWRAPGIWTYIFLTFNHC